MYTNIGKCVQSIFFVIRWYFEISLFKILKVDPVMLFMHMGKIALLASD